MPEELQDAFDEIIPGAGDKATLFLKVIQERAERERVGLTFSVRQIRKTAQFVLEAPIQFGGVLLKGLPMKVIVHADPIGSSLQVGWQLTQQELHAIASWSDSARAAHASAGLRNLKPENQRALSGMLKAFHVTVFVPVLGQLVQAVEAAQRPNSGGGFLGA